MWMIPQTVLLEKRCAITFPSDSTIFLLTDDKMKEKKNTRTDSYLPEYNLDRWVANIQQHTKTQYHPCALVLNLFYYKANNIWRNFRAWYI